MQVKMRPTHWKDNHDNWLVQKGLSLLPSAYSTSPSILSFLSSCMMLEWKASVASVIIELTSAYLSWFKLDHSWVVRGDFPFKLVHHALQIQWPSEGGVPLVTVWMRALTRVSAQESFLTNINPELGDITVMPSNYPIKGIKKLACNKLEKLNAIKRVALS